MIDTRYAITALLILVLVLALASAALAAEMGDLTGRDFGEHHSLHAQTMGFDGDHNPGVHHQGFSGWTEHHAGHTH